MPFDPQAYENLLRARTKKEKLPPKPIAKVSDKKKEEQKTEKELAALDKIFYAEHWASCDHKCEQCGKHLGNKWAKIFFHHALPKARYPEFRHEHINIIMVCAEHHSQAETDLDKVPIVKKRTEEIRSKLLQ